MRRKILAGLAAILIPACAGSSLTEQDIVERIQQDNPAPARESIEEIPLETHQVCLEPGNIKISSSILDGSSYTAFAIDSDCSGRIDQGTLHSVFQFQYQEHSLLLMTMQPCGSWADSNNNHMPDFYEITWGGLENRGYDSNPNHPNPTERTYGEERPLETQSTEFQCPEQGNIRTGLRTFDSYLYLVIGTDPECDGNPNTGTIHTLVSIQDLIEVPFIAMVVPPCGSWRDYNNNGDVDSYEITWGGPENIGYDPNPYHQEREDTIRAKSLFH